jgi:hypothetical protein
VRDDAPVVQLTQETDQARLIEAQVGKPDGFPITSKLWRAKGGGKIGIQFSVDGQGKGASFADGWFDI